jgi:hypothetical protein
MIADIGQRHHRFNSKATGFLRNAFQRVKVAVSIDDNVGSIPCESKCDGSANVSTRAGNYRGSTCHWPKCAAGGCK